jgi:hypothetical protein
MGTQSRTKGEEGSRPEGKAGVCGAGEAERIAPSLVPDGKDARVVMDPAVRTFDEVNAFYMSIMSGVECVEVTPKVAEKRWGVRIRQCPHWLGAKSLREREQGGLWRRG